MKRVIFDILLLLCLLTLPWWVTLVAALIGLFIFKQFYEFIIAWIIMFSLFAIPGSRIISSPILSALIIGLVYVGVQVLRRYIILYRNEI